MYFKAPIRLIISETLKANGYNPKDFPLDAVATWLDDFVTAINDGDDPVKLSRTMALTIKEVTKKPRNDIPSELVGLAQHFAGELGRGPMTDAERKLWIKSLWEYKRADITPDIITEAIEWWRRTKKGEPIQSPRTIWNKVVDIKLNRF